MMKPWNAFLAVVLLFSLAPLSGCKLKGSKSDPRKESTEQPVVNPLVGDFATACRAISVNASVVDRLRFTKTESLHTHEFYSGISCSSLSFTAQTYSTYSIGLNRGSSVFDIDYKEGAIVLTPATEAVKEDWNRIHHCGISDWKTSWPRSIDKLSGCMGDTINNRPVYSVVKIDGNNVYLGSSADRNQDGLLPENRYTQVGTVPFVRSGGAPPPQPTACPSLQGNYLCGNSVETKFSGKQAAFFSFDRKLVLQIGPSNAAEILEYFPENPVRNVDSSGFTISTRDLCESGMLRNHVESSRTGDSRNRSVTERTFQLRDDRALVIDTYLQDFVNDRPGRIDRATTVCARLN